MIKNKRDLLRNVPEQAQKRRKILLDMVEYTLNNLQPEKLLKSHISKIKTADFERIILISIGKAGKNMAKVCTSLLKRKPYKVFIADKGHPLPTENGVRLTQKIITACRRLREKDLAIVLISGGGSAMLVSPVSGITLKDKIKTTSALLKSGAAIQEMNIVRKHLSEVKGGRLAKILYPANVYGLVISDVVGNDLSTIASGPLSPDKTTFKEALAIIKKYRIKAPRRVIAHLEKGMHNRKLETPKPNEACFKNVQIKIIADHHTSVRIAEKKAKKMRLKTTVIEKCITGEARDEALELVSKSKRRNLLIASGETTVICRGCGCGGRNQEFVLSAMRELNENQTIISIGTDGVDGLCPQPIAGAMADDFTRKLGYQKHMLIEDYLRRNDSYTYFKKSNGQVKTGPTGTNVGDLMMVLSD